MSIFPGHSIRQRFTYTLVAVVTCIVLFFSFVSIGYYRSSAKARLDDRLDQVATLAQKSLSTALWQFDESYVSDFVESLFLYEDILFVKVFSTVGVFKMKISPEFHGKDFAFFQDSSSFLTEETDISYQNNKVGTIQLSVSLQRVNSGVFSQSIASIGLLLLVIGAMSLTIYVISQKAIFHPLARLEHSATLIGTGDLDVEIDTSSPDEIGRLAKAFRTMIDNLKTMTASRDELDEIVAERTKALQEAQEQLVRREKLSVLGQMAGSVGHELRNPLATISNAVYYLNLVMPDADETIKEYLEIVAGETRNAEKIISDLLDFARIKSLTKESVDIPGLVELVLSRWKAPENIRLVLDVPDTLPEAVADRRHVEQVLLNLVMNASEAMPDGGSLTVSARQSAGGLNHHPEKDSSLPTAPYLLLTVQDTGCGISADGLKKIFEPLFTTKTKGIGLGLAISQNLIEANGGRIEVQSEPGEGSVFVLSLPLTA